MTNPVQIHREGALLLLTLNEPERANPLSAGSVVALTQAFSGPAMAPEVRAVIICGAGRHFCAGADLHALQALASGSDRQSNLDDSHLLEELYGTVLTCPKLTVAAVQGAAMGGGCGLATACDLVLVERSARLAYTEVKLGFIPALVSTFLSRRLPGSVARRLLLTAEILDGERACACGLADEVVEDGTVLERARERALAVTGTSSPAAIAATKQLLIDCVGLSVGEALALASQANADHRSHPECLYGIRTFLATKTTPDWLTVGVNEESPEGGGHQPSGA